MTKIDVEDTILLVAVSRKPDKETGLDTVEIIKPTSMQDTLRINRALTHAHRTLFDLTQKALEDAGVKVKET